jgi:cell division protein FtsX
MSNAVRFVIEGLAWLLLGPFAAPALARALYFTLSGFCELLGFEIAPAPNAQAITATVMAVILCFAAFAGWMAAVDSRSNGGRE